MKSGFVSAGGHSLEYQLFPAHQINRPTLVLLHEGLGSVAMWRDFPARLASATGCRTLVYSRYGYGQSDLLEAPFGTDYMHREGRDTLPELLAALEIETPVLVGHSDGATIALLHAAHHAVTATVVMAPHVFVEDVAIQAIAAARDAYDQGLRERLARHHADVDNAFRQWNDVWLSEAFRRFDIRTECSRITTPLMLVQGRQDEYGTLEQLRAIERAVPQAATLELDDCGHSPHKDHPESLTAAVTGFLAAFP